MPDTDVLLEENQIDEQEQASEGSERRGKGAGRPAGAKNKPKETVPFFDSLPSVDFNNHIVFLSRVEPITDRKRTGDYAYIQKFAEPFDPDTVLKDQTWGGSGVYKAVLYFDPGGRKNKELVAEHYFEVMNQAYPPRFPLSQWIDDPKNKRWAWARAIMEKEQNAAAAPVQQQQQGNNPADIVRAAKEMAQIFQPAKDASPSADVVIATAAKAYETGRTQGMENAKGTDLSQLLPIIRDLMPRQIEQRPATEDPIIKLMLENARADREAADRRAEAAEKRHSDLMTQLMAKKENTGIEVIGQFSQMFDMFTKIREGVGVAAGDDSWTGLLKEGIREALPSLAPAVAPMLGGLLQSLPLGPRPPQQQPQPNVPRGTPEPAQPPQQIVPVDPHLQTFQFIMMHFDVMLNKLKHPKTESPGLEFGDWIAEGYDQLHVERIKLVGTERIIEVLKTVPQAWGELGPVEANFRAFLNEFMTWTPEEAGGDDEPEPEPVIPVGKVEIIKPAAKPAAKKGAKK